MFIFFYICLIFIFFFYLLSIFLFFVSIFYLLIYFICLIYYDNIVQFVLYCIGTSILKFSMESPGLGNYVLDSFNFDGSNSNNNYIFNIWYEQRLIDYKKFLIELHFSDLIVLFFLSFLWFFSILKIFYVIFGVSFFSFSNFELIPELSNCRLFIDFLFKCFIVSKNDTFLTEIIFSSTLFLLKNKLNISFISENELFYLLVILYEISLI